MCARLVKMTHQTFIHKTSTEAINVLREKCVCLLLLLLMLFLSPLLMLPSNQLNTVDFEVSSVPVTVGGQMALGSNRVFGLQQSPERPAWTLEGEERRQNLAWPQKHNLPYIYNTHWFGDDEECCWWKTSHVFISTKKCTTFMAGEAFFVTSLKLKKDIMRVILSLIACDEFCEPRSRRKLAVLPPGGTAQAQE